MERELVAMLPRLRRMARALCRDPEDADELVQEVCERALRGRAGFTPGTRLDSWLYRIMQNRWIDRCRRRKGEDTTVGLEDVFDLVGAVGRLQTEDHLTLAAVRRAIHELPEDQRLALVLVTIEALSYREAAERLAVPLGTLMSRLGRARRRLVALLEAPRGAALPQAGRSGP